MSLPILRSWGSRGRWVKQEENKARRQAEQAMAILSGEVPPTFPESGTDTDAFIRWKHMGTPIHTKEGS